MVAHADVGSALFRTTRTRNKIEHILAENNHSLVAARMSTQERIMRGCVLIMSLLLFLDMGRQWLCLGSLGADDLRAGFEHTFESAGLLGLILADYREVQT